MSYEDIEKAQAKRAAKEQAAAGMGKRDRKRKSPAEEAGAQERALVARMSEAEVTEDEIVVPGMEDRCSVSCVEFGMLVRPLRP